MLSESRLFLIPSFSKAISSETRPLAEKAARFGLTPSLSRCFTTVFSVMPSFAIAESTMQIELDFRASVFLSNSAYSCLLITILTPSSSACSKRISQRRSQILEASCTLFGPAHRDRHQSSSALSSKVSNLTSSMIFCSNFSVSSALEPMPARTLSMYTRECRWNLGNLFSMFCRRLTQRWSDSLNCFPLSLKRNCSSSPGERVSLRLQQSLKIGWASDQVLTGVLRTRNRVARVSRNIVIIGLTQILSSNNTVKPSKGLLEPPHNLAQIHHILQTQIPNWKALRPSRWDEWFIRSISKASVLNLALAKHNNQSIDMERPLLLEVQCLLGRTGEGGALCASDVDLIDRAYSAPQTSELANSLNEIFTLLARAPLRSFFESFASLVANTRSPHTRLFAHTVLTRRIRGEWMAFDEDTRASLRDFLVSEIDRCLEENDQSLVLQLNQALVNVFRFEWNSLFKDFVSSLEESGLNAGPRKVLNNLTLLKLLLSEGFEVGDGLVSSSESQQFRESVEHDMRSMLKYLCQCLHNEGEDREEKAARVSCCLETLLHSVEYIPPFELFNCNLIEVLVGLIGVPQHKAILTSCFEEIFRFQEAGTTGSSHSKIAQKLLLILESYLQRFERTLKGEIPQEKESASTEDSFQSRKTRRRNVVKSETHSDLMYLLYEFLIRYVPFMDKARGEADLDIEYEGNLKLYFSTDLYQAFGMIFWRLVRFMRSTLERFDPFKLGEVTEEKLEESRKVVVCLRLLIAMQGKLKLQVKEEIGELLEMAVFNFTTLPPQFQPYYLHFRMLLNGAEVTEKELPFSAELQQDYKELVRETLRHKEVYRMYFSFLKARVEEALRAFQKIHQQNPRDDQWILELINTTNRASWSAVYAYHLDQETYLKQCPISTRDMALQVMNQRQPQELARCFSLNCKFLSQSYINHDSIETGLLVSLGVSPNETSIEFSLLLLSKILLYEHLEPAFSIDDLHLIVDKLHSLEGTNPANDQLLPLYPSFVRLLILIADIAGKKSCFKAREMLDKLVCDELAELEGFSMTNDTKDQEDLQRTVLHMRKLSEISAFLRSAAPKNPGPNHQQFVLWIRTALINAIQKFEFKNVCFREYLLRVQREHFDILHILQFRQYYLQALREHTALCVLVLSYERDSRGRSRENEKILKTIAAEATMRADFLAQRQFKCRQYFEFALEVYRLLLAGGKEHLEIVNASIFETTESLKEWQEDPELLAGKYCFWREIARSHLLQLSKKNREHLLLLLQEFELETTQATHLELILEVFEAATQTLAEECVRNAKPLLPEFLELFTAVFERVFSWRCRREAVFERVGGLLLSMVEVAGSLPAPLRANSRKDNIDVLYLVLQDHIEKRTGVDFDQQHCYRLHRLFQQRQAARWKTELRDYAIYLTRLHEDRQRQLAN